VIAPDARPRLASKVRVRFDRRSGSHVLLYPERGLALNATAAAIVELCRGDLTVAAIADRLASRFAIPASVALADARRFLASLDARGLLAEA
jgi:coenzyme PQQ biosynthesis protein PqqD